MGGREKVSSSFTCSDLQRLKRPPFGIFLLYTHNVSVHVAATLAKFLEWKCVSNTNLKSFIDLPVMVGCL